MILRCIKELKCFTERKLCNEAWRWNDSSKHGMRAGMLSRLPVINSKHRRQAGFRFSIGPETFRARRQILKSKLVELLQAPSSQTSQFCFLTWYFHCIIFKIIETLILSANTVYIKQLAGPEKLSGRSRNGPLGQNQLCNCNHFRHPIDK